MQNTHPLVFLVILNYNGKNVLPDCLASVYQSDYQNFQVVVVDNDSTDGSFEDAKQRFSRAHFIKNTTNVGFAKGNNIGLRFALEKFADYVFLLNNDAVIKKNTISELVTCAQKGKPGIISPLILTKDNTVWFAGGKIHWLTMKTSHAHETLEAQPDYISGCAMFVHKNVFEKVGLFDERYFLYYEDADLSVRAKKTGFPLSVAPHIRIIHKEQSTASNPQKIYWLVLSGLLFFKLQSPLLLKPFVFVYLTLRKIKNSLQLAFARGQYTHDVHRAYQDFKKISL